MIDETELCKLAFKYGSDKCPRRKRHNYTLYYYDLLKNKKNSIKKVLEIGIWQGASLYMWRDFFPNAQIYGADNLKNCLIEGERIKSFLCDQGNQKDLERLIKNTGVDIDLVVDDGSHRPQDQVFTCLALMSVLKKGIIYIIEDVADPNITNDLKEYDVETPKLRRFRKRYDNRIIVVRHK